MPNMHSFVCVQVWDFFRVQGAGKLRRVFFFNYSFIIFLRELEMIMDHGMLGNGFGREVVGSGIQEIHTLTLSLGPGTALVYMIPGTPKVSAA